MSDQSTEVKSEEDGIQVIIDCWKDAAKRCSITVKCFALALKNLFMGLAAISAAVIYSAFFVLFFIGALIYFLAVRLIKYLFKIRYIVLSALLIWALAIAYLGRQ